GLSSAAILSPFARPSQTTTYTLYVICQGCTSAIDSVKIIVTASPRASIAASRLRFCAGSGGTLLTAIVNDGKPPYRYQWSPLEGLVSPFSPSTPANPVQNITYSLLVSDANGCTSTPSTVPITVDTLPKANAGPDVQICKGSNAGAFLRAPINLNYDYYWTPTTGLSNPRAENPFASPDTTTIYTLKLIDRNTGCSSELTTLDTAATVTVFVRNTPIASVGNRYRSICLGDSIQIGDYPRNGGPNYTFEWTPSIGLSDSTVNFPKASPSRSTYYYFRVESNGCKSMADTLFIQVNTRPIAIANNNFIAICPKDSATIKITVSGGQPPYSYFWSPSTYISDPGASEVKVSPPQSLTYRIQVVDKNGCKSEKYETVYIEVKPVPELKINPSNRPFLYCPNGDSLQFNPYVSGNVALYSYQWMPPTGISNPTQKNPKAAPSTNQLYTLVVTFGNCKVKDSIFVQVGPLLKAQIVASQDTICEGEKLLLKASGNLGSGTFRWKIEEGKTQSYFSGKILETFPTTHATYYLELKESGCLSTDTFHIFVKPLAYAQFEYSRPQNCDSAQIIVFNRSRNARFYLWQVDKTGIISNEDKPKFIFQDTGTYKIILRIFNDSACIQDTTFMQTVRVTPPPKAHFTFFPSLKDTLYIPNATLYLRDSSQRARSWFWQFGDGSISEQKNPIHQYQKPGEYFVKLLITDENGCSDEKIVGPFVVREIELRLPDILTPNKDGINDTWEIFYNGTEDYHYQIFDRFGKQVYQGKKGEAFWSAENVPSGTYYYVFYLGKKRIKGTITILR
ncbi:MAG: PKD domain-containing protein, partial [Bacteroidia bacterium]|nr:PKD domain-containing protein [Bacteroidia bacterium]MDW8159446.1 PKD domain-containing protein [Bacteroidia bacterium]